VFECGLFVAALAVMLVTAKAATTRRARSCVFMVNLLVDLLSTSSISLHVVVRPSSNCYSVLESCQAHLWSDRERATPNRLCSLEGPTANGPD